jgi:hypothetical protein
MSVREEIVTMEYNVINGHTLDDLRYDVNQAIKKGWRPQGGVCVYCYHDEKPAWVQAMVKEVK